MVCKPINQIHAKSQDMTTPCSGSIQPPSSLHSLYDQHIERRCTARRTWRASWGSGVAAAPPPPPPPPYHLPGLGLALGRGAPVAG